MVFNGRGRVWDSKKGSVLCAFDERGVLVTEDAYIIEQLKKAGYTSKENKNILEAYKESGTEIKWQDRYENEHFARVALEEKYDELYRKYNALADTVNIPVKIVSVKEAEEQGEEELGNFYLLGEHKINKEIKTMGIAKLRSILKEYDALGDTTFLKVTKEKAVELTYKLLDRKGLLK